MEKQASFGNAQALSSLMRYTGGGLDWRKAGNVMRRSAADGPCFRRGGRMGVLLRGTADKGGV